MDLENRPLKKGTLNIPKKSLDKKPSFKKPIEIDINIPNDRLRYLTKDALDFGKDCLQISAVTRPGRKASTSTQTLYENVVERLRKKHDPDTVILKQNSYLQDTFRKSPFQSFKRLKDGFSKSTFYQYRSALINHALNIVEDNHDDYLAMLAKSSAGLLPDDIFIDPQKPKRVLTKDELYELSEALEFLQNFPPHNGMFPDLQKKMQDARALKKDRSDAPKRKRKSKKATLHRIMDLDRKYPERGHWRDRMWAALENKKITPAKNRIIEDQKTALALLSLTGARPNELLQGIRIHLLRPSTAYPEGRLLFRVPGSKVSTLEDFTAQIDHASLSTPQRTHLDNLLNDKSSASAHSKGMDYRFIEVLVNSPQAAYLKRRLIEEADGVDHLSQRDLGILSNGDAHFQNQMEWSHTFYLEHYLSPENIGSTQRMNSAVDALSKSIKRLGKDIYQGKDSITPYVFRHAFSADLKATYDTTGDLHLASCGLGHTVDRTRGAYAPGGKSPKTRPGYILRVATPRPVRITKVSSVQPTPGK